MSALVLRLVIQTELRVLPLGAEYFGQTGTVDDLYQHYENDTQAILSAVNSVPKSRPVRFTQN